MINLTQFITQSLSPALVLSAIGLLIGSLQSRMLTVAGRVREMNAELRGGVTEKRRHSIERQEVLMLKRIRLLSNSLFILYVAMGLMVLTAIALATQELHWIPARLMLPVWSFLGGLVLVFTALVMEAGAVALNMQLLEIDIEGSRP